MAAGWTLLALATAGLLQAEEALGEDGGSIQVARLSVEYLPSPMGLDQMQPHVSWSLVASSGLPRVAPSDAQQAFQVTFLRASDGSVLFSSGQRTAVTNVFVPEEPLGFLSDRKYNCTVQVWWSTAALRSSGHLLRSSSNNNNNNSSSSSSSASILFTTGLLSPSDWSAVWIQGQNLMRKTWSLADPMASRVARASLFVSACQYYELYLDNTRIGARVLDVGTARFDTNRTYATFDLAPTLFSSGNHAFGLMLGQGFCQGYQALLQLHLWDANDNLLTTVATDTTWLTSQGPILADSTYYGETYDARKEQPGWLLPSFQPSDSWRPTTQGPTPTMNAQLIPPIARQGYYPAVHMQRLGAGWWQLDFGQEMTGWARIQLPPGTPAGVNVTLKHAEALQHPPFGPTDGSVYMGNLFWAWPVDYYITRGFPRPDSTTQDTASAEIYEPRFTYHGFRFVEIETFPPLEMDLDIGSVVAVNVRSNMSAAATLRLGEPLLQALSNNSWWTESAALMSIPAGCAGRGERSGWTGDAAFGSESELFDFDTAAFYLRWMDQIRDSQCPDGSIGNGVPGSCGQDMDESWSTVYPTVAWNLLTYYNATGAMRSHYSHLQLYMNLLLTRLNATGLANIQSYWGDWNPGYPVPRVIQQPYIGPAFVRTISHITAAASVVHDFFRMADIAESIGEAAGARFYSSMAQELLTEYHAGFFDPQAAYYGDGTVVAQSLPLWLGATPAALLPTVVDNFAANFIGGQQGRLISVGFIGVRYLFEALSRVNRTDIALQALMTTAYPSFGFSITNPIEPATSLWESFDVFSMNQWLDESSRDHHYEASINTFLRKYLVGLDMPAGERAFRVVRVRPEAALLPSAFNSTLLNASVAAHTLRGLVAMSWTFVGGRVTTPSPGPLAPVPSRLCAVSPQFPVPAGGLVSSFTNVSLVCPTGARISSVAYAFFGTPNYNLKAWSCYGPQPPAQAPCQADVSATVSALCLNKTACDVPATAGIFGNPCNLPPNRVNALPPSGYQLIARVTCGPSPPLQHFERSTPMSVVQKGRLPTVAMATRFLLNVTVPLGSEGDVHVPLFDAQQEIWEADALIYANRTFIPVSPGIVGATADTRFVAFATLSGEYRFQVRL